MFDRDYQFLNDVQKQVVTLTDRNALVLAPAGTGKTKIIAMRSAYLIENKILPEELLCLTFTNKAAKEMKGRIELYIKKGLQRITIKTFHAFCYGLICSEKQASHFTFPCTIIDEADSDGILKQIIKEQGYNDDHLFYPEIRAFIENIKRYSLNFPLEERYNYKKVNERYFEEEHYDRKFKGAFLAKYGLRVLKMYQQYLKENNCADFMDLIVEAKYLLEQEPIRHKWNRKYRYIQVDEMQDTSVREYEIIKTVADQNNLAMFGDFNQTIYEWRGSSPKSMIKDFEKDFSPEWLTLQINYRSTKTLLDAANDYIRNSQLYPTTCKATSQTIGDKIGILEGSTKYDEINRIAQSIIEHIALTKSVAVLTRTNDYAKNISEVFQKEQIPCTVIEDTKFFRRKEIKDFLAFFDYSINPRNGHALLKICHHSSINLDRWLLEGLCQTKACYMFLYDWFHAKSNDPYQDLFSAYFKGQIVVLDVESTGLDTVKDDIVQIAAVRFGKEGVLDRLDLLVKPSKCVGSSYEVHGFSDELLTEKGIEPQEALNRLLAFTNGRVVVGHNVNYDLKIIKSMLSRCKLPEMCVLSVYDTLDLACKIYPTMSNHKLGTLADYIGTQAKPNHNAMQDILATAEVLAHFISVLQSKTQERLEKLEAYYSYIEEYKSKITGITDYILKHNVSDSIQFMMNDCGFKSYYTLKEIKSLRELFRMAQLAHDSTLSVQDNIIQLINYAALHYSELEQSDLFKDRIPIITIHQAKGLEFDHVYIAGCNDKIFPLTRSLKDNRLPEEKRLFYVGITRARKNLFLSYHNEAPRSIFIDEISEQYKEKR